MKERRHESGIAMIVGNGKPWVRRTGMGVDRDHGQATVTRRTDDPVQSDGVEPQLVSASNQITLVRHLDHVAGQEHFPAVQALNQNNASRFDVAPRTESVDE
jgi:hypothetical protein